MLYLQHTITLGILSLLTWGCGNSDKQIQRLGSLDLCGRRLRG